MAIVNVLGDKAGLLGIRDGQAQTVAEQKIIICLNQAILNIHV